MSTATVQQDIETTPASEEVLNVSLELGAEIQKELTRSISRMIYTNPGKSCKNSDRSPTELGEITTNEESSDRVEERMELITNAMTVHIPDNE